ncbi:hypothetical protein J8273_3941 [Carpediemonas membranifera]|uniref:Uncharacterized protein n=1 Tax=Carpediemonas membranifera TaxID=201153 RepID=A0A8J6B7E0_9EUKA|nr:hypothetical protein J8273_3941 [Carpediemonas membranifera]|eukprot:KAG9394307.1 hypothetical protein J8273_3941 [Carpediemonas membranifera]
MAELEAKNEVLQVDVERLTRLTDVLKRSKAKLESVIALQTDKIAVLEAQCRRPVMSSIMQQTPTRPVRETGVMAIAPEVAPEAEDEYTQTSAPVPTGPPQRTQTPPRHSQSPRPGPSAPAPEQIDIVTPVVRSRHVSDRIRSEGRRESGRPRGLRSSSVEIRGGAIVSVE